MKKSNLKSLFLVLQLSCLFAAAQPLSGFKNLVNNTWVAEGTWENGTVFKQEVHFSYGLNESIVIASTKGFIDKDQKIYGDRNHGIRQYNKSKKCIEFWEFDTFGNLTKGTVKFEGKSIWYTYQYGDTTVTDYWQYVDEQTYNFKVGNYENNEWKSTYLKTQFKLKTI